MRGPAHERGHPPHPPRAHPHPESITSPILVGAQAQALARGHLGLAAGPRSGRMSGGLQWALPCRMVGFWNLPGPGRGRGVVTDCFSFLVASRPLLSAGDPHRSQTAQLLEDLGLGSDEGGPAGWVRETWGQAP